ncbi:CRISPR-associated protein Cas4 [Neomoorella humiferrea]|uniref:CRISPR-associated exonuclease Cas4 n=1 Tax=Neomoorella humiferrea TaxID=676965 RepID=A0A2T0AWF3_9FIRM|nr:CRISPR-associated protein Cas4 [Moorella humiferrea]PRR75060.1 PD-(D/E)XK nuclease superfamily protein [Moorella humiferrea]
MIEESLPPVNGTLIWYYTICPRQAWLMARQMTPDENDDNVVLGRFLHEKAYSRDRHEVQVGHIKIDLVRGPRGEVVIGEIKKSSHARESARLQLKYYLYILKKNYGLDLNGVLLFPLEKEKEEVTLDATGIEEVERAIEGVRAVVGLSLPPPPVKTKWCRPCAYAEYCWA